MKTYYHGTRPGRAGRIRAGGFKIGKVDLFGDGDPVCIGDGNIGFGTYLTTEWRVALWFGRAILKVHLTRGTRILRMERPPDKKVLTYLRREFGKGLFETTKIQSVIPHNKKLSLSEYIALLSYHYERTRKYFWNFRSLESKRSTRKWKHVAAMHGLGSGLQRFGIHGFGEERTANGIVVFQPSRVVVDDLVVVVPDAPYHKIHRFDLFDKISSLGELQSIAAGNATLPA